MTTVCYAACAIALLSALLVITRRNAMHALLSLILMLLSLGLIFFTLGAPFLGVLQVVVYAGAIMVLFVFVVMMLNLARPEPQQNRTGTGWVVPGALAVALLGLGAYALAAAPGTGAAGAVGPKEIGLALYGRYVLIVELASLVLTAGLIAAFHLAPPTRAAISRAQWEVTPHD